MRVRNDHISSFSFTTLFTLLEYTYETLKPNPRILADEGSYVAQREGRNRPTLIGGNHRLDSPPANAGGNPNPNRN